MIIILYIFCAVGAWDWLFMSDMADWGAELRILFTFGILLALAIDALIFYYLKLTRLDARIRRSIRRSL